MKTTPAHGLTFDNVLNPCSFNDSGFAQKSFRDHLLHNMWLKQRHPRSRHMCHSIERELAHTTLSPFRHSSFPIVLSKMKEGGIFRSPPFAISKAQHGSHMAYESFTHAIPPVHQAQTDRHQAKAYLTSYSPTNHPIQTILNHNWCH